MCLEDKNSQNFPILLWTLAPTQKPKPKKKKNLAQSLSYYSVKKIIYKQRTKKLLCLKMFNFKKMNQF